MSTGVPSPKFQVYSKGGLPPKPEPVKETVRGSIPVAGAALADAVGVSSLPIETITESEVVSPSASVTITVAAKLPDELKV